MLKFNEKKLIISAEAEYDSRPPKPEAPQQAVSPRGFSFRARFGRHGPSPKVTMADAVMASMSNVRRKKIAQKQLKLRERLWPSLDEARLWLRTEKAGFTTIPRTMPLILQIMDALSKGKPVSSTYLEIWCRAYDDCFVTLAKPVELAFYSGFTGQRALATWRSRMQVQTWSSSTLSQVLQGQ